MESTKTEENPMVQAQIFMDGDILQGEHTK